MLQCPQCGQQEHFSLEALQYLVAYIRQHTQDSSDGWYVKGDLQHVDSSNYGGIDWDEENECTCSVCHYAASVKTFTRQEN